MMTYETYNNRFVFNEVNRLAKHIHGNDDSRIEIHITLSAVWKKLILYEYRSTRLYYNIIM